MKPNKQWWLVFFLWPIFLFAQESLELDLEQSVNLALKHNPELRIAEEQLSKAKAGIGEAIATLLPTVTGTASLQHAWEIQKTIVPNFIKQAMQLPDGTYILPGVELMPDYLQIAFGIENQFYYGVSLTQPIFLGGAGWAGIKIARNAKIAAEQNFKAKRQEVIYNTINAFYACLLTKEVISVQEQAVEQAKANLDLVRKKYESGTASGFDKMRAEVDLANLQPQLISARNAYQSALTRLRMVMGISEATSIELKGNLEFVEDPLDSLSLDEVLRIAKIRRPEVRALKAQESMASGGLMVARSQFLPKLVFQTDYSFLAMRNDYKFTEEDFSKGFTSSIGLQIPLFTGFNRLYSYHKARMDYKIVKDSQQQLSDGITAEAEMAFHKFHEAKEKYRSAKESIAMAEEALRLANLMYEEGASTQLDVMGARLALTQARLNYANALYEYQMARYGLRKATGILEKIL